MLKGIDLSLSFLSWRPADPFGDVFCWFGDLARIIGSEKVSDGFSIRARATMILALKFLPTHWSLPTSLLNHYP